MSFQVYKAGDREFRCTAAQAKALDELSTIRRGGIGTVHGYVSTTGRVEPETANIQFITAFSLERLYERKIAALQGITLDEVLDVARNEPKLAVLTEDELAKHFEDRRAMEIASMQKTLDGDRSDSRRQAHDTFYVQVSPGIKVHLQTYDKTELELVGGLPVAKAIMVSIIEINRTVTIPGKYKKVSSGAPVLMGNAIKRAINSRSTSMKTLSLKDDNFERLVVSRKEFLPVSPTNCSSDKNSWSVGGGSNHPGSIKFKEERTMLCDANVCQAY